jgi:hypothetical protein
MTHKKQKAAASLSYRVGHQRDFHSPQRDNIGNKKQRK